MPNILDSIQVSGSSYDIKDKNAPSVSAVTQQEYDNLPSSAKTSNTFFVITDATPIETSGFVQTSAITSSVTSASTDSEIPTAKAVFDAIPTGGTSITIDPTLDSGSTNPVANSAITTAINSKISRGDIINNYWGTVSLNTSDRSVYNKSIMIGRSYINNQELAIAIGTSQQNVQGGAKIYGAGGIGIGNGVLEKSGYGLVIGYNSSAGTSDMQFGCCAIGMNAESYGNYSTALSRTKVNNESEFGCGKYNVSNTGSTDADKTLFSVGNGTANNNRHNAFEIRQNGDIYLSSGGTDIKLQDHLGGSGGGGTVDQSVISGSTNAVSGGAVYTQLGGLKLQKITQSAYDALATKDANTLYVING